MTTYRDTEIVRTETVCLNNGRRCYELRGAVEKPASVRPFLTSLADAKAYVREQTELREMAA